MALQRLDLTPTPHPLGESIGSGLEALASHKLQQIQRQALAQGLERQGYPRELALLPPDILKTEMANIGKQRLFAQRQALEQQQQENFLRQLQQYGGDQYGQQPSPPQAAPLPPQQPREALPFMGMPQQEFEQNRLQNLLGQPTGLPSAPGAMSLMPQQQQAPMPSVRPAQPPVREARAPKSIPLPTGLTPQQYNQFATHVERAQAQANATNKKPLEELQVGVKTAKEMLELVNEMDELLATGKVATRIKGKLPTFLQNNETIQYAAKANELATLLAASQRGVPSAYRIKVAQLTKPSIEQSLLAQKGLQDSVRKKALDIIRRGDIADQIIAENNGFQPPNIMSIVNSRLKSSPESVAEERRSAVAQEKPSGIQEAQPSQEETPLGTLVRGGVRTAARFAEPLGEQLQNIASLGLGAGNLLTGGAIPTYGELRDKYPFLPPQQLSEITDKITQGYTAPRNEVEKFVDNIASTAGTLASTLVGGAGNAISKALSFVTSPKIAAAVPKLIMPFSGMPWQRALKAAAATEVVGKALEGLDVGPTGQTIGKIATLMVASGGYGKGAMLKSAEENYAAAEKAAIGKSVNVAPIEQKLTDFARSTAKGFDPNKNIIEGVIDEARNALNAHKAGANKVPINDLVKLKQQANKWYSMTESPRVTGEKYLPSGAKKVIGEIINTINDPIKEYGLANPEFGKPFAMAEDIWKGVKDVDVLNKWIENNFSHTVGLRTNLVKAFIKEGLTFTAGTLAEYGKLLARPATRNHLIKALAAAADKNKNAFGREITLLDKIIEKEER